MHQDTGILALTTHGPGLYEFTDQVLAWCREQSFRQGLLTLYVQHTSCSLTIQENADPDVTADLADFFARLVPRDGPYRHRAEGADDMPAHIKAALTQTHLSIPLLDGRPALGTWQGIYLFEHRDRPHKRRVVVHCIGT